MLQLKVHCVCVGLLWAVGWCAATPAMVGAEPLPGDLHRIDSVDAVLNIAYRLPDETPLDANALLERTATERTLALSLAQARAMALENNLDLSVELINPAIAQAEVSRQEAAFEVLFFTQVDYAKTDTPTDSTLDSSSEEDTTVDAGVLLPLKTGGQFTVDYAANRNENNNNFTTLNPAYTHDLNLSISQPLLRGAGVRTNTHAIRIAQAERTIASARSRLEVIRVLAETERRYWRLYEAYKTQEIRAQEYRLAKAQLERVRRMVAAGATSEVEIIRAEAGLASRLENVIVAGNAILLTQRSLKVAINTPDAAMDSGLAILPQTLPVVRHYDFDIDEAIAAARDNRMELLEAQLRIDQAASQLDYDRNQALPLLAVDYTYSFNGLGADNSDAFDQLTDNDYADHYIGLRLEVPLGNRGARSKVIQSRLARIQRLAIKRNQELLIEQDVRNAADSLDAAWDRLLANRLRPALAERELAAEQRQFELGRRTSVDVLDAQERFAVAQLSEVAALVAYQIAQVDLAYATGTVLGAARVSWEPENVGRP